MNRYDGHHVWSLPQHKPHEYGFRRIPRKPPFFKMRRISFPKVIKSYSASDPFNRTLQIEYNWQSHAGLYHDFNDEMKQRFPGVRLSTLTRTGNCAMRITEEDGRVIFDAATDAYSDVQDVVKHCYSKMLQN